MEIEKLKQLLLYSWEKETCSPGLRSKWSEENPSLGQCAITALIVNDIFGGKIMRCMASSGSHYYNLINDKLVDLTVEQFLGEIPDYANGEERTREYLLSNEDTKKRYLLLSKKLKHVIKEEEIRQNRYQMCVNQRNKFLDETKKDITLRYLNYNNLNIDEELDKIESCETAEIVLEPTDKKCLFILGMLFVNGTKIKILNEKDLNLEETNKSFSMMPYVWSKIGDDAFPFPDYSNVITEMDMRVENIKRVGVKLNKITNNPIDKKIFLICPVRNATQEQRNWIEKFVVQKYNEGYLIHAPHLHTRQLDLFGGYAICKQNAEAVATSQEIDIYYDQSSAGSVFDLGVAYALHKPLIILNKNEIVFNNEDLIDSIIKEWPYNEEKTKKLIHF